MFIVQNVKIMMISMVATKKDLTFESVSFSVSNVYILFSLSYFGDDFFRGNHQYNIHNIIKSEMNEVITFAQIAQKSVFYHFILLLIIIILY